VTRALWTGLALLGAVLVETALGYLLPGPGRYIDPFLLVVVYCALVGGETFGMVSGAAAGWLQDALFGGRVLGISALAKLLIGFAVGVAGARFLISGSAARALAVLLATLAEGVLVPWLASVFTLELAPQSVLTLLARGVLNAVAGGALFALVDRRVQRERL
jgi:rod shape-determining protein MreD